jgi:Zn-finger nucleic acid-binding protein
MQCPKDHTELQSTRYEKNINVDKCETCGGIWLNREKLEKIQETRGRDYKKELAQPPDLGYESFQLAEQQTQPPLVCPNCNVEMERREYARVSQILIDVCPKCHGIWLDKTELEALEVFYERARKEAE